MTGRNSSRRYLDPARLAFWGEFVTGHRKRQNRNQVTAPSDALDFDAILFEDDDLIAVNKPPGLPSQVTLDPKRPHLEKLVRELLMTRDPNPDSAPKIYLGMHQRLDRDTSGVIVFTKSKRANPGLAEQISKHRIQKTYWAIAASDSQSKNSWTITNHLAPAPKKFSREPTRQQSVRSGGDFAETRFRVLAQGKQAMLVAALPRTGRMHQIRVHLAEDGHAILGDSLYAEGAIVNAAPRLMLHARALEIVHPITHEPLIIEAPPPKDFTTLMAKLGLEPS